MSRTTWQSEPVHQLLKYRDENADLYWDPGYELALWISSSPDTMSDSPYIRIGGYKNFLEASGLETLEGLPGDEFITATFEIPDRRPGRPRERKEPLERSAIDLPVSLWTEIDAAKGDASRRAYIEAAIREKLDHESAELITVMDEWRTRLESLLQQYDQAIASLANNSTPAAEEYVASLRASYEWLTTVNQSLDNVVGISNRATRH